MDSMEMQSRLQDLMEIAGRDRTLVQWHEILALCEDLGHDGAWSNVKVEMEYWQRRLVAQKLQSAQAAPHTSAELASSDESAAIHEAWDKLLQTPSYVERDLRDVRMFIETQEEVLLHIEDDMRAGNFPVIGDLKSQRLGTSVSAQFDEQSGTLLIATDEAQVLLSALEAQALMCFLHSERDALYAALHKEVYSKYL